jgi:YesN/AraC family two-component response regulator
MAAEIVGLERTYFSRFFRNAVGQTFFEWNQEIRMQRAKTLLRRKDRSITSVALAVGYRDLTTFERAFKRCGRGMDLTRFRGLFSVSNGGVFDGNEKYPVHTGVQAADG